MNPRRVLALVAAVAATVLLVVRLASPPEQAPTTPPPAGVVTPQPQVSGVVTPPTAGDDETADTHAHTADIDDDSTYHREPDPKTAGSGDPGATAAEFAQAWTRHRGADARTWTSRLAALSTTTLTAKLADVDPAGVPATTVTGTPAVTLTSITGWADATVPTDAGTLHLSLLHTDRWRVDTLDWVPR